MADIGGGRTRGRERRISGWLTPFANQLFEGSRMGEAGLAADLKAYHGARRNEEIGDGWTRMEGVLAGGWRRRIETKRCGEEERERERKKESGLVDAWESWAPAGWCSTLHR